MPPCFRAQPGISGFVPDSKQRAWPSSLRPGTTFADAEHIVILMQENHSFDHALDSLQGVRGFNDPCAIRQRWQLSLCADVCSNGEFVRTLATRLARHPHNMDGFHSALCAGKRKDTEIQGHNKKCVTVERWIRRGGKYRSTCYRPTLTTCEIHARTAVLRIERDRVPIGAWLDVLDSRAPKSVVVVAMANKLARIAWAMLSSGNDYRRQPCRRQVSWVPTLFATYLSARMGIHSYVICLRKRSCTKELVFVVCCVER